MTWELALALIISYFCGAIPFGVIIGRFCGVDVRSIGSGNIGATNVWRALGPKAGTAVFLLDAFKGWVATWFGYVLLHGNHAAVDNIGGEHTGIALCAALAVLGHTFSVFLKFKGGKGIATAFGAMLGMVPLVAIGCFAWWGIVLYFSRFISVASIAACAATPIGLYLTQAPAQYGVVVILFSLVGLLKHLPNMKRLIAGTEPKVGQRPKVQLEERVAQQEAKMEDRASSLPAEGASGQ